MIMIHIKIYTDSDDHYRKITLKGHAGNADHEAEGQDLVCAAVSALTLNMANSIERFTEDRFEASEDEGSGGFEFEFISDISPESEILMNSLVFGLLNIEEEYGEPYINIRFEEV